jgi:hypothetical protein
MKNRDEQRYLKSHSRSARRDTSLRSSRIDSYGLIRISQQYGECPSPVVIGNLSAKRAERRVLCCVVPA